MKIFNVILAMIYLSMSVSSIRMRLTGGFWSSCTVNSYLRKAFMTARCKTINKDYKQTTINLDDCLGNNNGFLQAGWSGYSKSCKNCKIEGMMLTCSCQNAKQTDYYRSSINLNEFISNQDGKMVCGKDLIKAKLVVTGAPKPQPTAGIQGKIIPATATTSTSTSAATSATTDSNKKEPVPTPNGIPMPTKDECDLDTVA